MKCVGQAGRRRVRGVGRNLCTLGHTHPKDTTIIITISSSNNSTLRHSFAAIYHNALQHEQHSASLSCTFLVAPAHSVLSCACFLANAAATSPCSLSCSQSPWLPPSSTPSQGVGMEDVMKVLRQRFGTSGIEEKASRAPKQQ